jgi:4'-phosphopantetheinyl transferase
LAAGLLFERNIEFARESVTMNRWGKPGLLHHPEVHFNMTHCRGMAACAIMSEPVGIDAERVRSYDPNAAKHVCVPSEIHDIEASVNPNRSFFRLWALKESYVKALGKGLSYPMRQVIFRIGDGSGPPECLYPRGCDFLLWEDSNGFIVAACRLPEK